jgi:hypothetical protein
MKTADLVRCFFALFLLVGCASDPEEDIEGLWVHSSIHYPDLTGSFEIHADGRFTSYQQRRSTGAISNLRNTRWHYSGTTEEDTGEVHHFELKDTGQRIQLGFFPLTSDDEADELRLKVGKSLYGWVKSLD